MKVVPLRPDRFDLNGRWRVIHRVERSGLSRYVGLEIEFDVVLTQDGDRVTGEGEKFIVGWELVSRREASRLKLEGRADGDGVHLSVLEVPPSDPEREIVGEITWKVVTNDMLTGTFWVTAAKSAGTSRALRR
jgi:hypothetical protein